MISGTILQDTISGTKELTNVDVTVTDADGQIVADVNKPTADQMSELLMKEREAATMNVASARHSH